MKNRKPVMIFGVAFVLIGFLIVWNTYFNTVSVSPYIAIEPIVRNDNGKGFAGSESCAECHKDIYLSHIETAHFKSSRLADSISIKGNFKVDNKFILNDEILFSMNSKEHGFYQESFFKKDSSLIDSKRIDIVLGSGTKGQSYLNWQKDELNQLQVSYFEPNESWVNSPGYPIGIYAPNRPIGQRCLECHVTYAENKNTFNKSNTYVQANFMYGIDCERCHGPAIDHVNHHREYPKEIVGKQIISFSNFSQKQKLQACALCHSGIKRKMEERPFSFVAGDTVVKNSESVSDGNNLNSLDVHGNQYGLLLASKCFKKSKLMDCSSCHKPHENQRSNLTWFNSKCLECHKQFENNITCKMKMENRQKIDNNCVECHMPLTPSKSMSIYKNIDSIIVPVQVRTHFIAVYK